MTVCRGGRGTRKGGDSQPSSVLAQLEQLFQQRIPRGVRSLRLEACLASAAAHWGNQRALAKQALSSRHVATSNDTPTS